MTMKKVVHYFFDHSITVVSEAPLSEILNNRDATGRVAKWAIELLPLDIKFEAKKAIKSGLEARCIHLKPRVNLPSSSKPLHPGNPSMTRRTFDKSI